MQDRCGEASAISKLSSLTLQDRSIFSRKKVAGPDSSLYAGSENVEAFEFANSDWLSEFKTAARANEKELPISLNAHFEKVFAANAQNAAASWTAEFSSFHVQNEFSPSELDKFNQAFNQLERENGALKREFEKFELTAPQSTEWIEEFKAEEAGGTANDDLETVHSARNLLASLDLSDEKLARSKFVAYLRELAETDPCINGTFDSTQGSLDYDWNTEYMNAIHEAGLDQDPEDDEWRRLDKYWNEYKFNGLGYEGFALKQFSQYRFAADNPYLGQPADVIKRSLVEVLGRDLKDSILILEALCQIEPTNAENWTKLGQCQAENEVDVQAIAAFYRASELDPKDDTALIGLAAACVNEMCVPDALEALEAIAKNNGLAISKEGDRMNYLVGLFQNSSFFNNQHTRVMALSILYNLADEPEKAVNVLQNQLDNDQSNHVLWNRLGASLANAKRYDDAIVAYERALSFHPTFVRALYNMGISYMNQGNLGKALGFLIRALDLHLPVNPLDEPISDPLATGYQSIWNTIRLIGDRMDKDEINVLIEEKGIVGLKNLLKTIS